MEIKGYFILPAADDLRNYEVLWNEAYYTIGISDNRGLKGRVILKTDSEELEAEPGVRDNDIFPSGISFMNSFFTPGEKLSFEMNLNLSGSEGLLFTPLGKSTSVQLQSEWTSVFTGTLFTEKKTAWIVFFILVFLYVFIFVLLNLNDYAYLAGNIGLFLLLAIIMKFAGNQRLFKNGILLGIM